jgi:hypothetical protein
LQESAGPVFVSLQIPHHTSAEITSQINSLRVVQAGLGNAGAFRGQTEINGETI